MNQLTDDFIADIQSEQASLAKRLAKLADNEDLHGVLSLFDYTHTGALDATERALALRVLTKMHTPSAKGLDLLRRALTYLDVDTDQKLEHTELTLAIEILELFCKADSVNNTLSAKELGMFLSVMESLDKDENGVLDADERVALRDGLWTPDEFLAQVLKNL